MYMFQFYETNFLSILKQYKVRVRIKQHVKFQKHIFKRKRYYYEENNG